MTLAANRVVIGVGQQSARIANSGGGTAATATAFPRWDDGTDLQPELKTENIRQGDGQPSIGLVIKNLQYMKGKLQLGKGRSIDSGFFLNALFGASADSVAGAGPYVHTLTPQATRNYHTLRQQYLFGTPEAVMVTDVMFHSATITGSAGKIIDLAFDYMGLGSQDDTSALTPTYDSSSKPFIYYGGTFNIDGATTGAVAPWLKSLKIDYKYPSDDSQQTEAVTLADQNPTIREVGVEYELLWQDFTQFKKAYWGGGSSDSPLIGTGAIDVTWLPTDLSGSASLEFIMSAVNYSAANVGSPKLDGKALVQKVTGVATGGAGSPEITAKVKNSQSAAY